MVKSSSHKQVPTPQKTSNLSNIWIFACIFLFAFLMYANTLGHGYVLDDPLAIALNENVTKGFSGIADIIMGSYRKNNFGGHLYRPISLIQFSIEWAMSPNNPMVHHFFNVFWYASTVVLLFAVLRRWFSTYNILFPLFATLIFAAHPIHTEVIANIKSRDEIMSLFFILGSFLALDYSITKTNKTALLWSAILYFMALLSKESAITMLPIYSLLAWYLYNKSFKAAVMTGIGFVVPVLIMLGIRWLLFKDSQAVNVDIMDNPIVAADGLAAHLATAMVVLGRYLYVLFFPFPLSSDYSYSVIRVTGFSDLLVWVSILAHLAMLVWAIRGLKTSQFLSLCIFGYLMAISLYSQIFVVIGTMFGERLAYLPSLWMVVGVVYVLMSILKMNSLQPNTSLSSTWQKDRLKAIPFAGIIIVFTMLTMFRSTDWKDNFTLFTNDVITHPTSVRLHNGAANEYYKLTNNPNITPEQTTSALEKAEFHCNEILSIKPVATAYLTLGNIRLKQNRLEEALTYYDQVNDLTDIVDKNKAIVYRELGRQAGEKEQNLVKAQEMISKSISLNDKDAETWFLLGVLAGIQNDHQKAGENFEKAYALNPNTEYVKNIITAYQNLGNTDKVAQYQAYLNQ